LFWAMSKISAVWVDSTLLCNTSVISFLPIIYAHCVQQAANSSLRNSFLINLLLVVLDCGVPVVSTYGCLHCYFNFVTSLIQPAFPTFPLFSFILWICLFMTYFSLPLAVCTMFCSSLFFVCSLLRGMPSSEKHFCRHVSFNTFSPFIYPRLRRIVARFFW
jgi:hypothetical protein